MCTSSIHTYITGNAVLDLLIIMMIGLLFMSLTFPSLYSDYKDLRQEKYLVMKIVRIILGSIFSIQLGPLFLGLVLFLVTSISLIQLFICYFR